MSKTFDRPDRSGMERSPRASALIARIVNADEHRDEASFVEVLSPTASFRFGSAPPIVGLHEIRATV